MEPKTNPLLAIITLAVVGFLAWFVYDGYVNSDPAATGGNPAARQQPRLN